MAERFPGDGVTMNGFGRRSLHEWVGRLLYAARYLASPDFRAPSGWRLSRVPLCVQQPINLSNNEEGWDFSPSPPHYGDAGQGSSSHQPRRFGNKGQGSSRQPEPETPPHDSDDDNGGQGDYTVFYRQFGM